MKLNVKLVIGLLLFGLVVYGFNRHVLSGPRSPLMGYSVEVQKAFDSIKIGDSITEVQLHLGAPIQSGKQLLLPQRAGFERYFKMAEESTAKTYYLWMNGGNWFYSIGFDSKDNTVIKAEGHS